MEKEKTLCFTGHRRIGQTDLNELRANLYSAVARFILSGYEYFICGGAVGFDTMAAECILSFKERFPHIKLILALPCRDQTMKWENIEDLAKYKDFLGRAYAVEYMQPFYTDGCMHERNRWMVDHSSVCIACLTSKRGGTAYTYNYACKKGLRILNVATGEEIEGSEQLTFD